MKKKIVLVVFVTLFSICYLQPLNAFAAVQVNKYINDFNSVMDINDFDAYWVPDMGISDKEANNKHWEISDGKLNRINDLNTQGATKNMSVLALKNYVFMNFEATMKFKQGSNPAVNWGWCVIGFRQNTPGSYFIEDGAGAFLGVDGKSYLWGPTIGGPYTSPPIIGYNPANYYDVKIRVVGKSFKMYVNGNITFEQTLDSKSLIEGYVSITAVGTDCKVDQFTIVNLDENGNEIPLFNENVPVATATTAPTANEAVGTSTKASSDDTAISATSTIAFPNEIADEKVTAPQIPLALMIVFSVVLFIDTCGVAFLIIKSMREKK